MKELPKNIGERIEADAEAYQLKNERVIFELGHTGVAIHNAYLIGATAEAVRAIPLAEALKAAQEFITWLADRVILDENTSFKECDEKQDHVEEMIKTALSPYTGGADTGIEAPDEFVERHLARIKQLQKEAKAKFEAEGADKKEEANGR